jgi:mycofactocin system glycosyltransferase
LSALPDGFGLTLSASVRRFAGGRVLAGGAPYRILRLSDAGVRALEAMQAGLRVSPPARELAGRLVDGGLASPAPGATVTAPEVTVLIPVRDRLGPLERCLQALGGAPAVVVDDGSADPDALAALCRRHGARAVRRAHPGGPAAARNSGLAEVDTELVAFLDSDCVVPTGWLRRLSRHFADPGVGAVAPRLVPCSRGDSVRERYAAARSPLDLGGEPGRVAPGHPIAYVPTAALLVRRNAIARGFDEELRYGEDVDLVWRLHDAGWTVRYDPTVVVSHEEPLSWSELLARRHHYGTSAAALSQRHPGRLKPAILRPQPTAAAMLLLARRPGPALVAATLVPAARGRRLRRAGLPPAAIATLGLQAGWQTLLGLSRASTMLAAPALLAGLATRRTRATAAFLVTAGPLAQWTVRRPALDPLRWTAAAVADDIAYGAGVWRGCWERRTTVPLRAGLTAGT